MRMKAVLAGILACFSAAAMAADCVWTGGAGDGQWATPGNWEGEAAPTAADTAFVTCSSNMTIHVAEQTEVGCVRFLGSGKTLTLEGEELFISATSDTPLSNACTVVCNLPVRFKNASGNITYSQKNLTFNQQVTSFASSGTLKFYVDPTDVALTFNAPIVASNLVFMTESRGYCYVNDTVVAKEFQCSTTGSYSGIGIYFAKPITLTGHRMQFAYRNINCMAANVLDPTAYLDWTGYEGGGRLKLNGYDQTSDYLKGENGDPKDWSRVLYSDTPATLFVEATKSATTYVQMTGQVSLVYNAVDMNLVQTMAGRRHMTRGSLTAKRGTIKLDAGASFPNLAFLAVDAEGMVEVGEANGVANPFPGVGRLDLAAGGKLKLPEGVSIEVPYGYLDGRLIVPGTYSQEATEGILAADWIEGAGTVTVGAFDPDGKSVWKTGVTGAWGDADNWSGGVPSAGRSVVMDNEPQFGGKAYTVTVAEDAAQISDLTLDVQNGKTVSLEVDALLPMGDGSLTLDHGAQMEISDTFRRDGTPAGTKPSADSSWGVVKGGASLTVKDGGRLLVTNSYSRFTVGGGRDDSTGLLKVEAGGVADFHQGASNVRALNLERGGRVEVAGTLAVPRASSNSSFSYRNAGGDVEVTGDGRFLLPNGLPSGSNGGRFSFGTGKTVFRDNAVFAPTGGIDNNFNFIVLPDADGETCEVDFEDSSTLSNMVFRFYVGNSDNTAVNGTSILNMRSDRNFLPSGSSKFQAYTAIVGNRYGHGVFNLQGGAFRTTMYSLVAGCCDRNSDDADAFGEFRISGDAIVTAVAQGAISRGTCNSRYVPLGSIIGFGAGMWLINPPAAVAQARPVRGLITLDGAKSSVTCTEGHFFCGVGRAEGAFVQNGGTVSVCTALISEDSNNDSEIQGRGKIGEESYKVYNSTNSVMIGVFGGKGACIISNGTFTTGTRTFVGGIETNEIFDAWNFNYGKAKCNEATDSEGRLAVVGGRYEARQTVYVGCKGTGTVEIGPAGVLTAPTLVLSNQTASALNFKADATRGFTGGLTVTNLVIASGATLNVDLGGYTGHSVNLISAASVEGDFAAVNVTGQGDVDALVRKTPTGYRLSMLRGALLLVR